VAEGGRQRTVRVLMANKRRAVMQVHDYVIVGAGAAGCVLAYRLSERPGTSVLLIEAGPHHRHPLISMPKGLGKMLFNPGYAWPFPTEPEAGTAGKPENWLRGKVLGGSTSVNGMMYVRGQPADFEALAAQTSADWDWPQIEAAYRAIESYEAGASTSRGGSGPLKVTVSADRDRLSEAMVAAGVAMGLPRKLDANQPDNGEGIAYADRTVHEGRRVSAATAFLDPVRDRPNLTILTGALVDRVCFDGRRASGVELLRKGKREVHRARDVILAGGTLASPAILQRSGIGSRALLQKHGIPLVHDLPQVGQNLAEHRAILMQWKLNEPLSQNAQLSGLNLVKVAAQYFLKRTGPMAAATYEIGAWIKSRPELERPDIQFLMAPFSFDPDSNRQRLEPFPGMHIVAYPLRPSSRGSVEIRSADPQALPAIRPNYRSTAEDREVMTAAVRAARRWTAQSPLRELIVEETYPGPSCSSDAQIIEAYDRDGTCGYHAVGTCRMGGDLQSVVDPSLRVRGIDGLRVMDASVMPQILSGNTAAPTMAMAWRAADLILEDA